MKRIFFLFFLVSFLIPVLSHAQQQFTISGSVRDSANGESVIGASIYIPEAKTGANTNAYGFFSITLPAGSYSLVVTYVGKQPKTIPVNLQKNEKLNIEIAEKSVSLKGVEISAEHADKNVTSITMSTDHLDIQTVKALPVLFGEVDILKTITLLPGVMSAGEGNTGFYVRGGGPDQNLVLLDDATVYNASHLLGFFSVFNADAIKDMNLIKGGIPAEYGGRLASVLDVHMNDGNSKNFTVKGGIGLIASRLTIEGPIKKDRGSFLISGRRTYADVFLHLFGNTAAIRASSLYFYDLNLKANYRITDKDRIYLSGYFGRDVFGASGLFGISWGNATGTLRWNHIFNDKLFLNSSLIVSDYQYNISVTSGSNNFGITSGIRDYALKESFEYYLNRKNKIKFGVQSIFHVFTPGTVSTNGTSLLNGLNIDKKYCLENSIYISNEMTVTPKLTVVYGLRYVLYDELGPGTVFHYDTAGNITDTTKYSSLKKIQEYGSFEPRAAMRYILTDESSLKASYTRTSQFIQLLSNTTASTPTDLWVPSSNVIKPQLGDQYDLGYFRNFRNNMYEASVEVYYKNMQNQIDYKPGADIVLNPVVESQLYFGKGRSYGTEFLVRKNAGKFTGWIAYTLSRTERQFQYINNDSWYPAKQDRTHDISLVGMYNVGTKWSFGAVWVYATGNAVTFPVGQYEYQGHIVAYYSD
ncbi:MAG TPA: TonB-dependent receptor, partial [Bacteroidia bacterium]|nr:TonB-dependent receptor [Bacteroidia bacterium]